MISASKLSSLRLNLQPFTPLRHASGYSSPSHSTANNMVSISSSTVPRTPRFSPIPDAYMASPTPTGGSFILTPTRMGSPMSPDARSPILSVCVSEGCESVVLGERTACGACKESIHSILGKNSVPFPVVSKPIVPKAPAGKKVPLPSLSASHPRPVPHAPLTSPIKLFSRKLPDEPTSPDALYFGRGRNMKRRFRLPGNRDGMHSLMTNAQKEEKQADKGKKNEESWLEKVDA